eukprot:sb/3479526/
MVAGRTTRTRSTTSKNEFWRTLLAPRHAHRDKAALFKVEDKPTNSGQRNAKELDTLFYESVTLSERLRRCVADCSNLLHDQSFRVETELCREVLDKDLPVITPPGQVKDQEKEIIPRIPETIKDQEVEKKEDDEEEEEEGEVLQIGDDGIESDVTESDLELSDELTEVSSTASVSDRSEGESIELEVDDLGLKDCTVTRKIRRKDTPVRKKVEKKKRERDETRVMINRVEKQVSCKCCRSVMGRILHEVDSCENAENIAKLKPYQPKTSIITDFQGAVEFQHRYNQEWYAAIAIQRSWRAYFLRKVQRLRRAEVRRYKNEMRLKYGHIAHFVIKRDANKTKLLDGAERAGKAH